MIYRQDPDLIFRSDGYKYAHHALYPKNTTKLVGYTESRGGFFLKTVFFGLQYLIKEYLTTRITRQMVEDGKVFFEKYFGRDIFPYDDWMYVVTELEGRLPIRIKAIPEGTVTDQHIALCIVESTDERCFWIASWVETMLLRAIWYGTTVATLSWYAKDVIREYLEKTSDNPEGELLFKLVDFGARGVSSAESAAIGGAAHLINFRGSDTVEAIRMLQRLYNEPMAGFSIPASEHSTITSWTKARESEAYKNMLETYGQEGQMFACVSDSYDIDNAVRNIWGNELKQQVIDSKCVLVVRPDSGDPATIVLQTLNGLNDTFGSTVNGKGYKVLNHVRVIQGDGINLQSIREILRRATDAGYSATNLAFGMGGKLLQAGIDRDTNQFAHKCCFAIVDDEEVEVYKEPKTDSAKNSKRGDLDTFIDKQGRILTLTKNEAAIEPELTSIMRTVYENGELLIDDTFQTIRERSESF